MKRILLITVAAFLLACPIARAETAGKDFAIIDVQRVVDQSDFGKKMNKKVDEFFKKKNDEVEKKLAERANRYNALQKKLNSGLLSPEAVKKETEEFQEYYKKVDEAARAAEKEMRDYAGEIELGIKKDLFEIIGKLGEEKGYVMIFSYDKVLYNAPSVVDITDEIIKRYNEFKPAGGK